MTTDLNQDNIPDPTDLDVSPTLFREDNRKLGLNEYIFSWNEFLDLPGRTTHLVIARPAFGDLEPSRRISAPTFRAYLQQRAARNLKAAGPDFAEVDPAPLTADWPEPDQPALVHLDVFPGSDAANSLLKAPPRRESRPPGSLSASDSATAAANPQSAQCRPTSIEGLK